LKSKFLISRFGGKRAGYQQIGMENLEIKIFDFKLWLQTSCVSANRNEKS
jgi:hypothetical protein